MHVHVVRLRPGEAVPAAFVREPSAVLRVPAGTPVLAAAQRWLAARAAHAVGIGLHASVAEGMRRVAALQMLLAAEGWLEVGGRRLRLLRLEGYLPPDAADGCAHVAGTAEYFEMREGAVYFQRYAGGYGWGLSVRLPTGQLLVRAVDDEHGVELGMTDVAHGAAAPLGIHLGPHEARFHVPTEVGDVATDARVRLVLGGI